MQSNLECRLNVSQKKDVVANHILPNRLWIRIQLYKSDGATDRRDFSFILSRRFVMKIAWWRHRQKGNYCLMGPMRDTI